MRIFVCGDDSDAVLGMLDLLRHPKVNVSITAFLPDLTIVATRDNSATIPELSCSDDELVALMISQLSELGVERTVVRRDSKSADRELKIWIPQVDATRSAVERATFRSAMLLWAKRSRARFIARRLTAKVW